MIVERFAARYLPVIDLGIKKAAELCRQFLEESIQRQHYSLSKKPRVLPADAWKPLQAAAEKKTARKKAAKID